MPKAKVIIEGCKCPNPDCGKTARVALVAGYVNVMPGWRIYCAHCGYVQTG